MCVIYRTPSSSGSCSTNACRASNSSSVARASAAHEQQIATASWPKAAGNVISMAEWDRAGPRMSGKLNSCAELVQVGCWTLEQRDLGVTVTTYVRATCGTWLAHSRLVALHTDHHHRSELPSPSRPRSLRPHGFQGCLQASASSLAAPSLPVRCGSRPALQLSKEYVAMQKEPPPFVWAAPDEKNILTCTSCTSPRMLRA